MAVVWGVYAGTRVKLVRKIFHKEKIAFPVCVKKKTMK